MGNESGSVFDMTNVRKLASACAAAAVVGAWAATASAATSHADPAGHQVTYTITSTGNLTGNVRYINSDPPSQAAFDANSSQYLLTVPTTFSPGDPLVYTTTLNNPNQWAFVTASGGCKWPDCSSGVLAELHCEIAVDGQVVANQTATTGVTCSTRPW
ncbi:hypothetical protein MBOU_20830 [Mycobacterium bourgelatii]|uniref:Secreted protein n=2 Tax=Mycobacterium bourgelatii TaxID=1273442 RepID=A0A7I9YMY3_MYCBU|nr:hypothetical protein MBOU_20830 [Mycobacterium bourgelatii]